LRLSRKIVLFIAVIIIAATYYILNTETTILYVPLDNRPVNYDYVAELNNLTNFNLLIPPREYLNSGELSTDTEALWQWLLENANKADAMVLSLDTLYFGGLVPSRAHHIPPEQLNQNQNRLETLLKRSKTPVYAFSTIMRSAVGNESAGHPPYFSEYGAKLGRLSTLADKEALGTATPQEKQDRARLEAEIPAPVLKDYLQRRLLNNDLISKTLTMVNQDLITYYIIARDDSSEFSYSKLELRSLEPQINNQDRADTYPGADQIGALLFARAVHDINRHTPNIQIIYGTPKAQQVIPHYEDIPLGETISKHIQSLGGTHTEDNPDLALIVNMPATGTREAVTQTGTEPITSLHRNLLQNIQNSLNTNQATALVDVAYTNGADDALMRLLAENNTLLPLAAYSGWNTAGNSIGTALAHGSLYSYYHKRRNFHQSAHLTALLTRISEDWLYQTGIRSTILSEYDIKHGGSPVSEEALLPVTEDIQEKLNKYLEIHFPGFVNVTQVKLPWNRLFELTITFEFARNP
jgi:hypothetical protein